MKIILAFDSFKGSMSASEAVAAATEGIRSVYPDANIVGLPLADGGEGTTEAMCRFMKGRWVECASHDPLFRSIKARYYVSVSGETAVMEMAECAGLTLLNPMEQNPMKTTSFGVGEMIRDAVHRRCKTIYVGVGGSATNDAGMGMLSALGYRFLSDSDTPVNPVGEEMIKVSKVDVTGAVRLKDISIVAICDVKNPLYGKNGAAYIYAGQKGASSSEIASLDEGLRHFSSFFPVDAFSQGCGAAGGLGFGLKIIGATLSKGIDVVISMSGLQRHLRDADLVITGEGRIDKQTLYGKLPIGVLNKAKACNVPVIALAGSVTDEKELLDAGFKSVQSINPPGISVEQAMMHDIATANMQIAAANVVSGLN